MFPQTEHKHCGKPLYRHLRSKYQIALTFFHRDQDLLR